MVKEKKKMKKKEKQKKKKKKSMVVKPLWGRGVDMDLVGGNRGMFSV